jgi:hypothetical protein
MIADYLIDHKLQVSTAANGPEGGWESETENSFS